MEQPESELGRVLEEGMTNISTNLRYLGNGDANTPMGAIEALGKVHMEGLEAIADAIRSGLEEIADAVQHHGKKSK